MDTVKELVAAHKQHFENLKLSVNDLEASKVTPRVYLTDGFVDDLPEEVVNVQVAADDLLLACKARGAAPLMVAICVAADEVGIDMIPGEVDSFGWLSIVIETRKGSVVVDC